MVYISKTKINIDGITIHYGLSLPLNCKHLQSLSLERLDSLSKTHDQLQFLVLDEVSFIGSRIFFLSIFVLDPLNMYIIIFLGIWMS
jgi:hypothetical protein